MKCEGLARARLRAGLTQQAAADAVGVNRVLLSYYENGRRQPPLGVVVALARLYGVSLSDLVGDTSSQSPMRRRAKSPFRGPARIAADLLARLCAEERDE